MGLDCAEVPPLGTQPPNISDFERRTKRSRLSPLPFGIFKSPSALDLDPPRDVAARFGNEADGHGLILREL